MRFFQRTKDGGPKSTVDAFFLIEVKWLFSVAFLRFNKGTRTNYHSHAFNAWTWFLKGDMEEQFISAEPKPYYKSFKPKFTPRNRLHRVHANKVSWCFTIRGPWSKDWYEYNRAKNKTTILTLDRKELYSYKGIPYGLDTVKGVKKDL